MLIPQESPAEEESRPAYATPIMFQKKVIHDPLVRNTVCFDLIHYQIRFLFRDPWRMRVERGSEHLLTLFSSLPFIQVVI